MGTQHSKALTIDKRKVESTLYWNAQGTDILSRTTRYILDTIPIADCKTLTAFRYILIIYAAENHPKDLASIANVCALAIKIHTLHRVPVQKLSDVICEELHLPWII